MSTPLTLFLVRHAQSQNNALPEHQRVSDPALTALGQQQAIKLSDRLHEESTAYDAPEIILTSPFLRTLQTIHPSAKRLEHQPVIWSNLYEAGGCYDGHEPGKTIGRPGMNRTQIEAQFPGFVIPQEIDENGWYREGDFEPWEAASARAKAVSLQLLESFSGSQTSVLCMIHGDLIRLLLSHFCNNEPVLSSTNVANTSVTCLRFDPDNAHSPAVLMHNNTDHLNTDEISL